MKTLYLESIAGIAGDMFTASFLDAGLVSLAQLQTLPQKLAIPEVLLLSSEVIRSSIRATHLEVQYNKSSWQDRFQSMHHQHTHSDNDFHVHFRELEQIIIHSELSEQTKKLACKILDLLAEAEAHCHGVSKEKVAFHELGMVDSLLDIVMAAYCISIVNPDKIISTPVKLGRGMISIAHGYQPVPPPVSAALALGMTTASVPEMIPNKNIELSTPTGLAILKALEPCFSDEWPAGNIKSQGYGAGTMDLCNYPNLFRVCLLETTEENYIETQLPFTRNTVIEISANFDDTSPEYLAWVTEKLFAYGALDVWQSTAVGKKNRVTIILSVLVDPSNWANCVNFILKKTPTFGLRYKSLDRLILERHFETKITERGSLQVKVGSDIYGNKLKEKFEYEEARHTWDDDINT